MLWDFRVLLFDFEYLFKKVIVDLVLFYGFFDGLLLFEDAITLIILEDRRNEPFCQNLAVFLVLSIVPNPIPVNVQLNDKPLKWSILAWILDGVLLLRIMLLSLYFLEMPEIVLGYFCLPNSIVDLL